jgi:type I restriction enzyme S subunit
MVKYLRAANVKDGKLDLTDVKSMNFTPNEQKIFGLRPGDVLVTEGSGSLGTVGASAVWNGEIADTVCFQNTLIRLRPRQGIDGRFLLWWARSAFNSGIFASIASGANIYHLSADRVRSLTIQLPDIHEQRRIADFLDTKITKLDHLIKLHKKQNTILRERQQAIVSTVSNRLIEAYGEIKLRRLLLRMEQGWSPQCEERPAEDDEWGVIKAGCVNGGTFDPSQHKALPKHISPRQEYKLEENDLLMSRASGSSELIGSVGIVPHTSKNFLLCDKIYRLKLDRTKANERFIAHMMRSHSIREHIKMGISGAEGMANNLPTGVVKNCSIPAAPLAVQTDTAEYLDNQFASSQTLISLLDRQIELLAERRQALITAAVTGQFDVSTASGRGVEG